ncbi:hypothetical protein ACJJTC_017532 [Scirpophaga incertulas]
MSRSSRRIIRLIISTVPPSKPLPSDEFHNDNDVVDISDGLITPRMALREKCQLRLPIRFDDYVMMSAEDIKRINEPKTYKDAITSPQKDRWLNAMENYGILYKRSCNVGILECYSDSDHSGDQLDAQHRAYYVYTLEEQYLGRADDKHVLLYQALKLSWLQPVKQLGR